MITVFIIEILCFQNFFSLAYFDFGMYLLTGSILIIGGILWRYYNKLFDYLANNNKTFNKLIK